MEYKPKKGLKRIRKIGIQRRTKRIQRKKKKKPLRKETSEVKGGEKGIKRDLIKQWRANDRIKKE